MTCLSKSTANYRLLPVADWAFACIAHVAHFGADHRQVGSNKTGHSDVKCHRASPFASAAACDGCIVVRGKVDAV